MGAGSGFALKLIQWFNRGVQFACAGLILALTSYFLAAMSNHDITIPTSIRAVEGISGVAVLYTGLGILFVCCLAGFTLTSFLAMLLDTAFLGAFIYIASTYRDGASSCSGSSVKTVFGSGDATSKVTSTKDGGVPLPTYRTACRMESAMFAVSIVAIVFFVISALTELGLGRHRKKEQRFGPSPANNYTSGYPRRGLFGLFRRKGNNDVETNNESALPEHTTPEQIRQSNNTETTYVADNVSHNAYPKYGEAGYNEDGLPPHTLSGTASYYNDSHHSVTPAASTVNAPQPYGSAYRYGDGTYPA